MTRLIAVSLFCLLIGCTNKQQSGNENTDDSTSVQTDGKAPIMDFKGNEVVNLGQITEGKVITHTFEFENTGNAPLKIDYANASCGCTVPTWPKEPIAVGEKSSITVEFNSKNKEGKLFKNVSIHANTKPEMTTIGFNVEVLPQTNK